MTKYQLDIIYSIYIEKHIGNIAANSYGNHIFPYLFKAFRIFFQFQKQKRSSIIKQINNDTPITHL